MIERPPCEHPYDGWFVDGVALDDAGFLVANFVDGAPPRRGVDLTVARAAGQRFQQKFYDARTQTVILWALKEDEFGNVEGGAERNVDRLKRLFGGGLKQVELLRRLSLPFGRVSTRRATVEFIDALEGQRTVLTQAGTYVNFALEIRFANPFWHEPTNRVEGAGSDFVVFNPGTVTSRNAVVRIHGPAVEPILTCEPAGTVTKLDRTIAYGDFVEIDSAAFTAVDQDGDSVAGDLVRQQVPIVEVAPGRNAVTLSDGTCDFSWEPAFL